MDVLHPQREHHQPEQRSPAIADDQKQSSPSPQTQTSCQSSEQRHEKVKLREINSYLTCHLCEGYLIDATTISECLHSFCRSCIIRFLEDNSFCPVCEVIINKAKPNLKLDKTLQDIVYKLVPGLFLAEMLRRKRFYAERPGGAAGASPEQRGEDTERTIFNPQDRISLSLEYIGETAVVDKSEDEKHHHGKRDAATSGLILKDLRTTLEQQQRAETDAAASNKSAAQSDDAQVETLLKRYLQCPGMCRIDVIKKFIRNKYNVNTDMFQIDILYKRVPLPLPDHYTLIDVAYIYTWKRNEPMRFYFRIIDKGNDELPDLTKVFTPIEAPPPLRPQARCTPPKKTSRTPASADRKKRTSKKTARKAPAKSIEKEDCKNCDTDTIESESGCEVKVEIGAENSTGTRDVVRLADETNRSGTIGLEIKKENEDGGVDDGPMTGGDVKTEKDSDPRLSDDANVKEQVYTNITLNRSNNVEIITKIQKVSGKDGQSFGVNIINQTVKKNDNGNLENVVQNAPAPSSEAVETKIEVKQEMPVLEIEAPVIKSEIPAVDDKAPVLKQEIKEPETNIPHAVAGLTEKELERKKFAFLKSIELTSKKVVDNLAKLLQKQQAKALVGSTSQNSTTNIKGAVSSTSTKPFYSIKPPVPNAAMEIIKTKKSFAPKPGTNGVKRKNPSPIKNESKKVKAEPKRTTKIILQQKPGFPAIDPLKPNETQRTPENAINQSKDLHSLFQNCRLNIPSSLSITLKENGETSRKPLLMPPVQNYIEILKIDEKEGKKTITLKREDSTNKNSTLGNNELAEEVSERPIETTVAPPVRNEANNSGISIGHHSPKTAIVLPKASPVSPSEPTIKPKESKDAMGKNQQQQSFQKIFEESIKRSEVEPDGGADPSNAPSAKRNILEIAQQLYKKTKIEQELQNNSVNSHAESRPLTTTRCATPLPSVPIVPKIAIPRLNNQRVLKAPKRSQKYENLSHQVLTNLRSASFGLPQHHTLTNLHSSSLGLNYTVSVGKQSKDPVQQTYRVNGVMSPQIAASRNVKNAETGVKSPTNRSIVDQTGASATSKSHLSPDSVSVKSSPSSSPKTVVLKIPSGQLTPKVPKVPHSPRPGAPTQAVAKAERVPPLPPSKKISSQSSPKSRSGNGSPKLAQSAGSSSVTSTSPSALTPNELLEKYNIQNLAQLSASINFNAASAPQNYLNAVQGTQMAALHQAMLLKQFEMQNRQKWLNINQGPLLQFEKYLQSLNASKNQILGNLKDN